MADRSVDFQLDWNPVELRQQWVHGPDLRHFFRRMDEETVAQVLRGGGVRRMLDVACAEARNAAGCAVLGVTAVALDPSPAMLQGARAVMAERGVAFPFVRGLAETLPFRDGSFDRVLCHSALDHVADPDLAVREMARVLADDGRLILSAVNYGGLSVRWSRFLYRQARRVGLLGPEARDHQNWDSPVPVEHTFECSLALLRRICAPYLDFESAAGVSLGWGTPGWSALLERLPARVADTVVHRMDWLAGRRPTWADFVYATFRPRPRHTWRLPPPPAAGGFVVQPDDVTYPFRARREAEFWRQSTYQGTVFKPKPVGQAWANRVLTGDPTRHWFDDLVGRGPFERAAMLGCDEEPYAAAWLRARASAALDIYDLSPYALATVRRLAGAHADGARFIEADLNFARLPAAHYDVIWSSACLHHLINLEHLLAQIEQALRPGGLFVVHDFVGERQIRYAPARLARARALFDEIPARYRHTGPEALAAPDPEALSPFCGMRPAELLPLAAARFETVHQATFGYLLPLPLVLDLERLAGEAPELWARLQQAEADAAGDPALLPSTAYAVFRRR